MAAIGSLLLAGCGGDSAEEPTGTPMMDPFATIEPTTVETPVDDAPDEPVEQPEPEPPADPEGTITVGDQTFEVSGRSQGIVDGEFVVLDGDFGICEADNPAFPGDANIVVDLGDIGDFGFGVEDDVPEVRVGEILQTEEITNDVRWERNGRTITGRATLDSWGEVTFDLTC